jgi:hypothetical protein
VDPATAPVDGVGAAAGAAVLVVLEPCMLLAFSPPQAAASSEIPATPSMYAKRASFM